tara:strand:+ start:100 stop:459 length:360 start_codon:yes stop_codon:yes gene_type:complete
VGNKVNNQKGENMKGPKRICPGEYEWDVFDISKIEDDHDGSVYWNIGVREGYWFGDAGYFDAGYGLDSCNTYADARYIVEALLNNPMFKVKYKGKVNCYGNWECYKDENGDYIIDKEVV